MSMKKIFKIGTVVLSVILAVLLIYFIAIHFNGFLNKNNSMTREEVVELLEKGKSYSNYYYSSENRILFFNTNENKTEYYIKDNIIKSVSNGELLSWTDYNNDEIIHIWRKDDGKCYVTIGLLENYEDNNESQRGFDYSLISNEEVFNTDFEYMGEKIYEGRTTILIKVWNRNTSRFNSTIFYIDKDTGLVMRRIDYTALGFLKIDCNRNIKLDVVTDSDIQRPNLEEFEVNISEPQEELLSDITKIEISVIDKNSNEGIQYTEPIVINNISEINTLLDIINSSSLYSNFDNDYGAGDYFEGCPLVELYTSDGNIFYLSACDNFDKSKELNIFYIAKLEDHSDKIIYKTDSNIQKHIENMFLHRTNRSSLIFAKF